MSETPQTSTNDTDVSEPPSTPYMSIRDLRVTESMASFFDEYTETLGTVPFIDPSIFRGTNRISPFTVNTDILNRGARTVDENATFRVPPLERLTTRRPNIWDSPRPMMERVQGLEPLASTPYIRNAIADLEGDAISAGILGTGGIRINNADGAQRLSIDSSGNTVLNGSISGVTVNAADWVANSTAALSAKHLNSSKFLDAELVKFFKEKLTLNISLSQLSAGLELKVSINLVDSGEELLSAEDFVRLD